MSALTNLRRQHTKTPKPRPPTPHRLARQPHAGKAPDESRDRYLRLQSCHRHSCTSVPTRRKGQVTIGPAPDVKDLRVRKLIAIPISRSNTQRQISAGLKCHAPNADALHHEPVTQLI